jgi:hypothetical protein
MLIGCGPRATEELTLVQYEMKWTTVFFQHQAKVWKNRKLEGISLGHTMYAVKQQAMWAWFIISARDSFTKTDINN